VHEKLLNLKIRIVSMHGHPDMAGRRGYASFIDSLGQIHGTWGRLPISPSMDSFVVVDRRPGIPRVEGVELSPEDPSESCEWERRGDY
jgi:hypothetical protein